MTWANTNRLPRDTTGTDRAPNRRSSSSPPSSANTLIDWNSIPRTERYSFTLRQLVQCGCQKTLIGSLILAPRRFRDDPRVGFPALQRAARRAYSPGETSPSETEEAMTVVRAGARPTRRGA